MFSAMSNINTENARSTVSPRVTFSPESGLIQKTSKVKQDNMTHGTMML